MKNLIEKIPQFLFFTGKGGAGKTSMSCAISLALAKEGKKVLLISTDPASNLDEVLETKLKSIPTKINGVENLEAMNINPVVAAHEYKEKMVAPFRGVLPQSAIEQMEEQLSGACTVEIAGFNEFSKYVGDIDMPVFVGDMPVFVGDMPVFQGVQYCQLPANPPVSTAAPGC